MALLRISIKPLTLAEILTGGQEAEKAYVVGDTECGTKKR
jgi:hypothetical protein